MDFIVMSEDAILKYELSVPHIVVSVRTPDRLGRGIELPSNPFRRDTLFLEFHDLDDTAIEYELFRDGLFSDDQAKQIKEFVEKHSGIDCVVLQCEAGISRSAGICAALKKHYDGDDSSVFKNYLPNRRVYRMLLDRLQGLPPQIQ